MNKHLKFAVFFAIAWLIGCSRLYAAIETIEKSTQTNQPFVGQSVTVADDKFINSTFDWSSATTTWIKNRVYLRLLDFKTKIPFTTTTGTRYNVNLSVITYNDRAHPTVGSAPVAITLQVNYNPTAGSSYAGLAVYDVPDANVGYQMKVTVVSISNPDNAGQTVFPNQLQVSAAVSVNRQYNFDAAKAFSVTGNVSNGGQQAGTTKQLSLSWISPGTQEFDVEWATVDKGSDVGQIVATMDPALPGYNPSIDPTVLDQIFMNNASRITTAGNSYVIALLYNNDFVVARVRLVYYDANGNRKRGNWNYMCKKGTSSTATYNFGPSYGTTAT
ncbi:MAG: hypothetical protein JWQ57_3812 [Mucilaginibacter sp.]|nr:hypothetical protein [Mucilaginibacter sp.]